MEQVPKKGKKHWGNKCHYSKRHSSSSKVVDRLTYNPTKHKQRKTRELRQKLQQKTLPIPKTLEPKTKMKFGSFNVNGLNVEATWAVQRLVETRVR